MSTDRIVGFWTVAVLVGIMLWASVALIDNIKRDLAAQQYTGPDCMNPDWYDKCENHYEGDNPDADRES